MNLIGPTTEDIAWHKAAVFKPGSLAFSSSQPSAIIAVLEKRAAGRKIGLEIVMIDSTLPTSVPPLKPTVQRQNCSLALAITRAWLQLVPKLKALWLQTTLQMASRTFYGPEYFRKSPKGK